MLTWYVSECDNVHESDANCEHWASRGDCLTNKEWMIPNCRKSCWKCDKKEPRMFANEGIGLTSV